MSANFWLSSHWYTLTSILRDVSLTFDRLSKEVMYERLVFARLKRVMSLFSSLLDTPVLSKWLMQSHEHNRT